MTRDHGLERVLGTFTAYQRTAALRTAVELDLFTAIGEGMTTVASLARARGASERGIRSLCDFLVVEGFLEKKEGRYRLSEIAATYLGRRSPAFLGDVVHFLTSEGLLRGFGSLTEAVRRGRTALADEGIVSRESPAWVDFARFMEPLARPMAVGLAEILVAGQSPYRRILDVAAGHGLYGIEIAKRCPGAEVFALDWPAVLEVARRNATAGGVAPRFHPLPGSAFEAAWGDDYDLVLLVNILHHFDADGVVELLRRARAAAREGGRVVALEAPPNEDRVTPGPPAVFSLVMLATTPGGDAYTLPEYERMFHEAGLGAPSSTPLTGSFHKALVARK